jgi:hypothetical protein
MLRSACALLSLVPAAIYSVFVLLAGGRGP